MVVGFGMSGAGMWLGHGITDNWGFSQFAAMQACRGVGTMMAMIATTQLTMSTLPQAMIKDASGLVNLARNVGGALSLALLSSTLSTQTAIHMGDLSIRVNQADQQAQGMLHGLTARMGAMGVADPSGAAFKAFHFMMSKQAQVLAFGDAFSLIAIFAFTAAAVAVLAKPRKAAGAPLMESH
jgi:DHA2 family multidrug resistance protein